MQDRQTERKTDTQKNKKKREEKEKDSQSRAEPAAMTETHTKDLNLPPFLQKIDSSDWSDACHSVESTRIFYYPGKEIHSLIIRTYHSSP
mmetsp:Transcript_27451/g.88653  ORF Transcript_27451/g.88653 Transcript_27451/m.88653 type:complete len:90 (+) Transcript_27451:1103-1372(+)